jgi:hypothetical protein
MVGFAPEPRKTGRIRGFASTVSRSSRNLARRSCRCANATGCCVQLTCTCGPRIRPLGPRTRTSCHRQCTSSLATVSAWSRECTSRPGERTPCPTPRPHWSTEHAPPATDRAPWGQRTRTARPRGTTCEPRHRATSPPVRAPPTSSMHRRTANRSTGSNASADADTASHPWTDAAHLAIQPSHRQGSANGTNEHGTGTGEQGVLHERPTHCTALTGQLHLIFGECTVAREPHAGNLRLSGRSRRSSCTATAAPVPMARKRA